MTYGTIKVDTVTFTDAGIDKSVTLSGLVQNPTFSGNVTVTGTLSGVTVTGTTANFTSGNFTNISGGTHTITSGVFAAGSAASPSITFTGDLNTGIYSPGADQVAISTGGSGRLFVDASGNVTVNGGGQITSRNVGASPGLGRIQLGESGAWTVEGLDTGYGGSGAYLKISSGTSERLRITSAGLVGVGTSSPSVLLDVYGTGSVLGKFVRNNTGGASGGVTIGNNDRTYTLFGDSSIFQLYDNTAATTRVAVDTSGRVGVGTTPAHQLHSYSSTGSSVAGSFETNQSESYITFKASGTSTLTSCRIGVSGESIIFLNNGANERARIDSSGRVGIGTSSPSTRLHVNSADASATYIRTENTSGYALFGVDGSGNAYAGSETNDGFGLVTNGFFRMNITAAGNVGIGTNSPSAKLHVVDTVDNAGPLFENTGARASITVKSSATTYSSYVNFGNPSGNSRAFIDFRESSGYLGLATSFAGGYLTFSTDNQQERARIDSSGRLLVGTSSAFDTANTGTSWLVGIEKPSGYSALSIKTNEASSNGAYLNLGKSRGTTANSKALVNNNDELGGIYFEGADGASMLVGARVAAFVDGTPGASDLPTRLVFSTTADGASSPTERMRIRSNGIISINRGGDASPTSDPQQLFIGEGGTNNFAIMVMQTGGSSGASRDYIRFYNYLNQLTGSIQHSGATSVSYNTSSDYRLKENIAPVSDGIERLLQLKPSRFNFIAEPERTVDGFIAHEVQQIVPEAINGEKDGIDSDGNPIYQGIDQSKLVPLLTAALQEAIGEIESLKARVAALESA